MREIKTIGGKKKGGRERQKKEGGRKTEDETGHKGTKEGKGRETQAKAGCGKEESCSLTAGEPGGPGDGEGKRGLGGDRKGAGSATGQRLSERLTSERGYLPANGERLCQSPKDESESGITVRLCISFCCCCKKPTKHRMAYNNRE